MAYELETDASEKDIEIAENGGFPLNEAYTLLAPGIYLAKVDFVEEREWLTRAGVKMISLRPSVVLLTEDGTVIDRQDFTFSAVDDNGKLYRPDGDETKSPIWGGVAGAEWMLLALGLLVVDPTTKKKRLNNFDPKHVQGRIVRVKTAIGGYIKGVSGQDGNWDDKKFIIEMKKIKGGSYAHHEVDELIAEWNSENRNEGEDPLRGKNMIVGWSAPTQEDIKDRDWFSITENNILLVFEEKAQYNTWKGSSTGQIKADKKNKPTNGTAKF